MQNLENLTLLTTFNRARMLPNVKSLTILPYFHGAVSVRKALRAGETLCHNLDSYICVFYLHLAGSDFYSYKHQRYDKLNL